MPPNQYHKPETALTKARELIKCDKKANALEILYDVMRARRTKQWQKVLEDLMMLFVELCVELKKNGQFRKAIYQYKNASVLENTASLEQVVRYYLLQIKNKTDEAQQESKTLIMDVEDLDVIETPESLLLNAVSMECTQDRSARTILMPWLKFLWDSYRLVLDLLRTNSKLEKLYHEVANDAYDFCIKFGRKAEFRKLCELIRQHTQKVQNQYQPTAQNAVNLSNPETQTLHIETRLRQLDCAMELEMYNEAFKTVEDIWNFILMSRKPAGALLMTNYYSKSAELFLRSGCHLYHAAALHKLFTLYRDHKKNITLEELSVLGSRVLCATVSIQLPNAKVSADKFLLTGDYTSIKQKTLASLLGLLQVPTRQSLIRELVRHKITSIVPPELAKLYKTLEADFQPLKLLDLVQPSLQYMSNINNLSIYIPQLQDVIVSKTLLQLSQVYQSIKFEEFFKLCPFAEPIRLERSIIELIHNLELPIRVNHLSQAIFFDKFTDLGISQCEYGGQLVSQSTHVNNPDKLSRQLTLFAQVMQQITDILEEDKSITNYKQVLVSEYRKHEPNMRLEILNRYRLIEQRKEEIETMLAERDQYFIQEEARRQAEQKLLLQSEEANLIEEAKKRELMKAEEQRIKVKRHLAQENYHLFSEHKIGTKLDPRELTEEQLDQFDADKLLEKKAMEVKKKRKEIIEKAKLMSKKLDYFVRAVRLEEIPLLKSRIEPEANEARQLFESSAIEMEEQSKSEHARKLKERNRLIRMKTDVQAYASKLREIRDAKHMERLAEWESLCERSRAERLAELKAKREAEAEAKIRALEEEEEREEITKEGEKQNELNAEVNRNELSRRDLEEPNKPRIRGEFQKDLGNNLMKRVPETGREEVKRIGSQTAWARGNQLQVESSNAPGNDFGSAGPLTGQSRDVERSRDSRTGETPFTPSGRGFRYSMDSSGKNSGWQRGVRHDPSPMEAGSGSNSGFPRGPRDSLNKTGWSRRTVNSETPANSGAGGGNSGTKPFGGPHSSVRFSGTISEDKRF